MWAYDGYTIIIPTKEGTCSLYICFTLKVYQTFRYR